MERHNANAQTNPYDPELMTRFHRLISDPDPVVSAIITGHLLVEEQLWQIVRESVANPAALNDARLSFSQLVALAEAVSGTSDTGACWSFVRRLNKLRNRCAHRLERGQLEAELAIFFKDLDAARIRSGEDTIPVTAENVVTAIFSLWLWIDPSPTFASSEVEAWFQDRPNTER